MKLQLARAETPTLVVVPDGRAKVEALVRSAPEAQLDNVLFVVAGDTVVLRARPGPEANTGALPGEPYARVAEMPNLFGPAGMTVEPPLRRDRLRTWLAPDPDVVSWLTPSEKGFRRASVAYAAFRPLSDWVGVRDRRRRHDAGGVGPWRHLRLRALRRAGGRAACPQARA